MAIFNIQSAMNRGELDPRLLGRIDLDAYYNGVRTAANVVAIPQGGLKWRNGSKHINNGLGDGRLDEFSFSTEQNYLLVFTDLKMEIYKDGVLQTNINASGNDFLATPWTLAQVPDFDYLQSADTVIVTHPDVEPQTIVRTSDTDWTITPIAFVNIPQFDFNDGSSPVPVSEIQEFDFESDDAGDTFKISLEGILTDEIVQTSQNSASDVTTAKNMEIALQALPNTGNSGVTVAQFGAVVTGKYRATFADNSAKNWDLMGFVRQSVQNSAWRVTVTTIQNGTARSEDVWSATRGWPTTATFHEGRLWFGGSKSRPQTLWGSKVNDFFNFDKGQGRDDEGITATLDTDQVNAIEGIFSNRSLQIFTTGGEFFVRESPVTPSNIAVIPQSNLGSKRVRPVTIDGVTLFVQRTGKSINQFVFINEIQANQARSITALAPHLINNPIKMAIFRGIGNVDANYVYILNDDGTLTVFNTLIVENVQGFTSWLTSGNIKSVAVVDDKLYLLVERVINSLTVYQIEVEDPLLNTDAGVLTNVGGSDTLTGLDHLEGETVDVKADGAYQGEFVVTGGEITIEREAQIIEAGLPWVPLIKTMPLNVSVQNGPNAFRKKKIQRISLQLFESIGIIVNGQRIADKTIGLDQFDPPSPFTGAQRIYVLGWSLDASVTITRDTPFSATILNIGVEVAT